MQRRINRKEREGGRKERKGEAQERVCLVVCSMMREKFCLSIYARARKLVRALCKVSLELIAFFLFHAVSTCSGIPQVLLINHTTGYWEAYRQKSHGYSASYLIYPVPLYPYVQ